MLFKRVMPLCVLLFSLNTVAQNTMKAGQVVSAIQSNLTCEWTEETVDTFKSGSEESIITGVATTFLANLDVLQRAKSKGLNMVITHEPTFYNHFDDKERYGSDPVLMAKLKFVEENNMVIWRFHDHWHRTEPDGIYLGLTNQLGWWDYKMEERRYSLPETTLGELAADLKKKFNARTIRVIGDPKTTVSNVALVLGAPGSMAQIAMLKRDDIDVLVGGETPEWETVEYVRDAIAAGMNKSLILLGHAHSEEGGMEYCAEWMKKFVIDVPVEFIAAGEPFWAPE